MMKKKYAANFILYILMAGMMMSFMAAGHARASEIDGMQEKYKGITFYYKNLSGHKDSVEVIGVNVPKGTTVLEIPEVLGNKKVISVDLWDFDSVLPRQDETRVGIKKLVLPKNIRPMRTEAANIKYIGLWDLSQLECIEVDKRNKYLKAQDGILYNGDMSNMLYYPDKKKDRAYKMPSSVTWSVSIHNDYLKRIVFSKNKKYTDANASNCKNLESIYLPDNVTEVNSFNSCYKLKKIRWSRNLKIIGDEAFENDSSLTELNLPDKVKEIGAGAFRYCPNLKKVSLPESVRYVGISAFAKTPATKKIKKATYLLSPNDKRVKGYVNKYRYVAVVTVTSGRKKRYFDSQGVTALKSSQKEFRIKKGARKTVNIYPEIMYEDVFEGKKGWRMKTDILSFRSSNPRVAKVTSSGKIKGLKKGKATITARMKTTGVTCRVKVTVK